MSFRLAGDLVRGLFFFHRESDQSRPVQSSPDQSKTAGIFDLQSPSAHLLSLSSRGRLEPTLCLCDLVLILSLSGSLLPI